MLYQIGGVYDGYTYFYRNTTLNTGDNINTTGVTTGHLGAFEGYR